MLVKLMLPAEFSNGGSALTIEYYVTETIFGNIIIASTTKGICYLAFHNNEQKELADLKLNFPHANFMAKYNELHKQALLLFGNNWSATSPIIFHVKATDFQLQVWHALLKIPLGQLTTYGAIARSIHKPDASRAVGTAIGSNPIAFLIPCHRVVQASGKIGGYMWGVELKKTIINWESKQEKLF